MKKSVVLLLMLIIGVVSANVYAEDVETIEYTEVPALERIGTLSEEDAGIFTSKRLIVIGDVKDTCGAIACYRLPSGETILEYESEEAAELAYRELSSSCECYPDEVIEACTCGVLPCDEAWCFELRQSPLAHDVTVAVLDTGVCAESGYLAGRILDSSYDYIRGTSKLTDLEGHGTHVAGIIAKNTPDNVGIMSLRVISDVESDGSGVTSILVIGSAIRYALSQGADVINLSLDLENASEKALTYLDGIIQDAYDRGVVTCVAAGNDGAEIHSDSYPACIGAAVTVGSVNSDNRLSDYSNYGKAVDFVAPGENIVSAGTRGVDSTAVMSGTSMSAPYVAACFAYLAGENPEWSAQEMISMLRDNALDLGAPGRDDRYGWGLPMLALEPSHEHRYTKTISSPATCENPGVITYYCAECGDTRTEDIPATGHNWTSNEQNAFVCIDCGSTCTDAISGKLSGVNWTIESAGQSANGQYTYNLILSGNGPIESEEAYPWNNYRNGITSIRFEGSITGIGERSFFKFENLRQIEHVENGEILEGFPESLESIGEFAFFGCNKIQTMYISKGITHIEDGAFANCRSLKAYIVDADNSDYSSIDSEGNANLYDKDTHVLVAGTSAELQESVREIRPYAYYGSEISYFSIGSSIERIGKLAFGKCFKLSSVKINRDASVEIASDAFGDVQADVSVDEQYYDSWKHDNYGGKLSWSANNFNARTVSITVVRGTGSGGNYDFTGEEVRPEVRVETTEGIVLREGKDYSLIYTDNTMPGTACVIAAGIGEYRGSVTADYVINPIRFSFRDVKAPEQIDTGCELTIEHPFLKYLDVSYEIADDGVLISNDGVVTGAQSGNTTYTVVVEINGREYAREYSIDVVAHEWDAGTVLEPAGYGETGTGVRICTRCGMEEYYDIPALLGAPAGARCTLAGIRYRVTGASSVRVERLPDVARITIPASVMINGKRYRVTSIGAKAGYRKSRLKTLVIGSNVTRIGSRAFYGCKRLRSVVIRGRKISSFGSKSFGRINSRAKVKVPGSKFKTYKKKLKKAGLKGRRQKVGRL